MHFLRDLEPQRDKALFHIILLHSVLRELIRYGRSRRDVLSCKILHAALNSRRSAVTNPSEPGWAQPHSDVRACIYVHTHTHTYQSPAVSCKYNLEYSPRATWTLQGRHPVSDRSGDICMYLSTSVGLSVVCNDAIVDYLHTGMDGWIDVLFATHLSIRSPGASRFYQKMNDGSRPKIVPGRVHCTKHENISRRRHDFRRLPR